MSFRAEYLLNSSSTNVSPKSEKDILDYLSGKDVDIKDAHKKFTAAVQSNEFGKPQTVIDIDFTKEGDPTTKDINLIFLA